MVYSHWLGLEPGPGQELGPVLCRTFHIAQESLEELVVWF